MYIDPHMNVLKQFTCHRDEPSWRIPAGARFICDSDPGTLTGLWVRIELHVRTCN